VRADPDNAAQEHDDENRDSPDDQLELAGIYEFRHIAGALIIGAKPPGEPIGGDDGGNTDRQHDDQRIEKDLPVGGSDRALRRHDAVASREQQPTTDDGCRALQETRPIAHHPRDPAGGKLCDVQRTDA
jgi:hypothetical protein